MSNEVGSAEVQCSGWTSAAFSRDCPSPWAPHARRTGSGSNTKTIGYSPFDLSGTEPINQLAKVSRLGPRQRMGLFFGLICLRIKIRGAQEKVVRLWIELH